MKLESIAKICHDANRSYCQSIGDFTQKNWENAPDWQKESAITGVLFHLQHPNAAPSDSHNSWLKQKESEGWKFGEVKDVEKKEHPCYVPYEMLPLKQQKKDFLFIAVVNSFRDVVELEVVNPEKEEIKPEEIKPTEEKGFQFTITISGSIKKPVFNADSEEKARELLYTDFPHATIHSCSPLN